MKVLRNVHIHVVNDNYGYVKKQSSSNSKSLASKQKKTDTTKNLSKQDLFSHKSTTMGKTLELKALNLDKSLSPTKGINKSIKRKVNIEEDRVEKANKTSHNNDKTVVKKSTAIVQENNKKDYNTNKSKNNHINVIGNRHETQINYKKTGNKIKNNVKTPLMQFGSNIKNNQIFNGSAIYLPDDTIIIRNRESLIAKEKFKNKLYQIATSRISRKIEKAAGKIAFKIINNSSSKAILDKLSGKLIGRIGLKKLSQDLVGETGIIKLEGEVAKITRLTPLIGSTLEKVGLSKLVGKSIGLSSLIFFGTLEKGFRPELVRVSLKKGLNNVIKNRLNGKFAHESDLFNTWKNQNPSEIKTRIFNKIGDYIDTTADKKNEVLNLEKYGNYKDAIDEFYGFVNKKTISDMPTKYGMGMKGQVDGKLNNILDAANKISITVRPGSKTGGATLEIIIEPEKTIKIRYKK